ncbi:MAG: SDR family NAD(P)-dependent oxidoreductase [Deltaproteobacteria bacterium]|nr:SDR family NAD(P)-dependent oxidoreductase [Deltaproteobacteria bacterium]
MSAYKNSTRKKAHPDAGVAIIGFALRFPGHILDEQTLWDTLKNGKSCITQIPEERWPVRELQHDDRTEPGRSVTFSAGVLPDIEKFDADFFGISPREAAWLDPQQRLLLELAYEAMENAGILPRTLAGSKCGVYVGISSLDYGLSALEDLASMSSHSMTGNTLSIAANRLAYVFDLHGPSLSIDTACSASLVALHYACQAIRSGEVPVALVGGVNLLLHPYSFVGFSRASMLSPDGHCRPFDAAANGYVRSEGGAVFLLKPLSKALADGDPVHAVLVASGINADGSRKTGITIPSVAGQTQLMRDVLTRSGLSPHAVDFVEAHGTGTAVGDPVEAASIGAVYGIERVHPLLVSSVKANLGHMEPAAGMAGLAKAVLALKNRALPPAPFTYTPNPNIDFRALNIRFISEYTPLDRSDGQPLTAAVNSFGFGGINAHVIVREFHPRVVRKRGGSFSIPPLRLSAKTDAALRALAGAYAGVLQKTATENYYDIAYTATFHRDLLKKRLIVHEPTPAAIADALRQFSDGGTSAHIFTEEALPESGDTAFIYSGNGAQWIGMGRVLLGESPDFARVMTELDTSMRPMSGFSLLEALQDERPDLLDDTTICQPLLFAIQVAVTMLLREFGVVPKAVMGHSMGEIAAAWAAGALDREQAIRVICARSQTQGLTRGTGRMAAVGLSEKAARKLIKELDIADVEITGINSPQNVTLSGGMKNLSRIGEHAAIQGYFFHPLDLDYAFHSASMDAIHSVLLEKLQGLSPSQSASATFVSSVTGKACSGEELDSEYWWRNVRCPVRFHDAVGTLLRLGCRIFVEIGPHAVLRRYISECAASFDARARVLPTLLRSDDGMNRIVETAMRTYAVANHMGIGAFFPYKGVRVNLPTYPWQKERYWHPKTVECIPERRRTHPLLGWRLDVAETAWENILDPAVQQWLHDHKVGSAIVFPGAGYVEMALAAAQAWLGGEHLVVEALDIVSPMVFDGDNPLCVRCLLDPRDGDFRILSRPRLSAGGWNQHASGCVLSAAGRVPSANMAALPDDAMRVDGTSLYTMASALGLDYGPAFRAVESVRVAGDAVEVHCDPDMEYGDGYYLPPAALDACFHSLVALHGADTDFKKITAFLPIGAGRVERCRQGDVSRIRARVRRSGLRSLTADFELLDDAGNLLAKASECRFQAMSPTRREKRISSWKAVSRLSPHPVDCLSTRTPSTNTLAERLKIVFTGNGHEREKWYTQTLPLLEAMALSFALEAFRDLPGDTSSLLPNAAYAQWLERLLLNEGLLRVDGDRLIVVEDEELLSADAIWQNLLRDAPECLPQLILLGRVGLRLKNLLLGRIDSRGLLEEIRNASVAAGLQHTDPTYLGTRTAIKELITHIASDWPEGRRLRVLEFSGFACDLTETLGNVLAEDCFQHALALSDPAGFEQAVIRYEKHAAVTVTRLEASQLALGDEAGMPELFDVVILRHVLHRAVDIRSVLAQVRRKTAPGGIVLLAERYPDWSADFLEGLDPAWWRQSATIPEEHVSSLLSPAAWKRALAQEGFVDCRVCTEPDAGALAEGAYIVLAKRPQEDSIVLPTPPAASWLLLADDASAPLAAELRGRLKSMDQRVVLTLGVQESHAEDFAHVVFMRGADDLPDAAPKTLSSLLGYARELADASEAGSRLWIVTRGGAPVLDLPATGTPSPAQCAVWGFGRVVMNEYPGLQCTLVDVPGTSSAALTAAKLEKEFLYPDGCNEILLAPDARYALMLREDAGSVSPKMERPERFRLDFAASGQLRNLVWLAASARIPAPGEIEARIMSVGLNFRDVMLTMGLLPDYAVENGFAGATLGLEFSGVVTKVGDGVRDFAPGDAVVGFAPACFASHVVTPASAVTRLPEQWDFAATATAPTAFFTAYYSLKYLALLQPGEKVLIHGAAGGVGLAAIQAARHLRAEIYATAGSDEKRDFLRLLGIRNIFDSRSLSFERDILTATNGEGVDAVLNSLAGEAMRRSIATLKPFGRFIELGKRDFVENTILGLRPFKNNISYFAVDADQLLTGRPQLAADVFREIMELFREGIFTPLPYLAFPADQAADAFRIMQQARHVGKIVVSCDEAPPINVPPQGASRHPVLDGASTWLITGGLSGFGLATARRLADLGVRRLVLVGRRGRETSGADNVIAEFAARGAEACAEACDIADAEAVAALIRRVREAMPPIRGIVHAAAVFDDRVLARLDAQSLEAVLSPKLAGAWHLHKATLNQPLDHFILYSSVSAALGNPGQAGYSAANTGLEGLTLLRRRMGLPASCVAWGPIGDTGYLARNEAVKKSLEQHLGRSALTSAEALEQFDAILADNACPRILANLDWGLVGRRLSQTAKSRFALVLRGANALEFAENFGDIQSLIAGKTSDEIREIVRGMIIGEVAKVLSLGVERIDPGRTLQSLGMDSLMAVELAAGLEQRFGIHLPAMMLQDAPTIDKVAVRITAKLAGGDHAEEDGAMAGGLMELARRHGEALSEHEAAAMIAQARRSTHSVKEHS